MKTVSLFCCIFALLISVSAQNNAALSEEALKKLAGFGDPGAQTDLGVRYLQPAVRDAHGSEALQWFLRAAATNYAPAEFNLGVMYLRGWGTTPDIPEAVRWFGKAGRHGMAGANAYMGLLLVRSQNSSEREQGFAAIRDAAKKGDPVAMDSLAYCYESGLGTAPNIPEAVNWYRRAVKKNDRGALHNLAKLYRVGNGVRIDLAEANRLDRKACESGNLFACRDLAHDYLEGVSVAQNSAEAYRFGLIGNADSQFIAAAAENLSPAALKELGAEAEHWKRSHQPLTNAQLQ